MYDEEDPNHIKSHVAKKVAATIGCEYFECSAMT